MILNENVVFILFLTCGLFGKVYVLQATYYAIVVQFDDSGGEHSISFYEFGNDISHNHFDSKTEYCCKLFTITYPQPCQGRYLMCN